MDRGAENYRRFLDGDNDGFVEIVKDYKDGLMLYINGYVKNIYTAEELMQDTFVRLVEKRPRFSPKYSFKTWLYTIGRNLAIDYLRKSSRHNTRSIDDLSTEIGGDMSVEREYLKKEEKLLILKEIDSMREEYRQILYLHFFEGLSNSEIAKVMKKNSRQVENLLYRSKHILKEMLEKEGFTVERLS